MFISKTLVTGSSGFVGSALIERLASDSTFIDILALSRTSNNNYPKRVRHFKLGDLNNQIDYLKLLYGVETLVHCAARVHQIKETATDQLEAYRDVNVNITVNLALCAAKAGVRRFIFISTIKVNGECTQIGCPFSADDKPKPVEPYGISKLEAELALRDIESKSGMEVVIVRPPLVYGPGVKANFANMINWVASGIPLPFGSIKNKRSFVSLDNLVDLLVLCLKHPAAAGQTFLVSDGEDVSTAELLIRSARAMNKKILLLNVPVFMLKIIFFLMGKLELYQRLTCSLQLDISKTRMLLNWSPSLSLDQGLIKTFNDIKFETYI
jgi:nucleoside-diphosphate-sugar epimerase